MAQANAKHMLGSGNTLAEFQRTALELFTGNATDAIQFAYNLTGRNGTDVHAPLAYCLNRMVEVVMTPIVTGSSRLGLRGELANPIIQQTRDMLAAKRDQLLDDFAHGMMGSTKLAKDPVISVINNQTNSPGAVQQVGLGSFSQSAFTQQQNALVRVIDDALASKEYAAIAQPQKEAFKDIADALKDEATKPKPDAGKLKRWGSRLVDFAKEVGLKVTADTLTKVLTDIFTES
jgi:hypothetical protein